MGDAERLEKARGWSAADGGTEGLVWLRIVGEVMVINPRRCNYLMHLQDIDYETKQRSLGNIVDQGGGRRWGAAYADWFRNGPQAIMEDTIWSMVSNTALWCKRAKKTAPPLSTEQRRSFRTLRRAVPVEFVAVWFTFLTDASMIRHSRKAFFASLIIFLRFCSSCCMIFFSIVSLERLRRLSSFLTFLLAEWISSLSQRLSWTDREASSYHRSMQI